MKYICGGRIASFGISLTVLEEIYDATTGGTEVLDEIELDRPSGREMRPEESCPSSQWGLGEEGALVGTTTPSGPSPPRGFCGTTWWRLCQAQSL